MSKRATVEPVWLDRMLIGWGRASIRTKGWPSVNPMLQSGIPSGRRSMEPTGVSTEDYRELEALIEALAINHRCAITRAYKPWTAKAMEEEWPCTSPVTWHRWLHSAAGSLCSSMTRSEKTVAVVLECN